MDTSYITEKYREKLRRAKLGMSRPQWVKDKIRQTLSGRPLSIEHKKKLSLAATGRRGYWRGKQNPVHSQLMREKLLQSVFPRFNPIACKVIDEYGNVHGYMFRHALNGGEVRVLGYSLDGYDVNKNVVIEVYERHHKKPSIRVRDEKRKRELINHLGCEFIELWLDV